MILKIFWEKEFNKILDDLLNQKRRPIHRLELNVPIKESVLKDKTKQKPEANKTRIQMTKNQGKKRLTNQGR